MVRCIQFLTHTLVMVAHDVVTRTHSQVLYMGGIRRGPSHSDRGGRIHGVGTLCAVCVGVCAGLVYVYLRIFRRGLPPVSSLSYLLFSFLAGMGLIELYSFGLDIEYEL